MIHPYRKAGHMRYSEARLSARLAEYEMLEGRAQFSREDLAKLETIVPAAMAALYSWMFSRSDLPYLGELVLSWIPVVLCSLAALRSRLRHKGIARIEEHMKAIEKLWADGSGVPGYHEWLLRHRKDKKRAIRFAYSRSLFWGVMIGVSFALAVYISIAGMDHRRPSAGAIELKITSPQ